MFPFPSQIECVGSIESGLLAMAWSPDQDVVVFVTGTYCLIVCMEPRPGCSHVCYRYVLFDCLYGAQTRM